MDKMEEEHTLESAVKELEVEYSNWLDRGEQIKAAALNTFVYINEDNIISMPFYTILLVSNFKTVKNASFMSMDRIERKYHEYTEKFPEIKNNKRISELRKKALSIVEEINSISKEIDQILASHGITGEHIFESSTIREKELEQDYALWANMGKTTKSIGLMVKEFTTLGEEAIDSRTIISMVTNFKENRAKYLSAIEPIERKYHEYTEKFPEIKNNKRISELRKKVLSIVEEINTISKEMDQILASYGVKDELTFESAVKELEQKYEDCLNMGDMVAGAGSIAKSNLENDEDIGFEMMERFKDLMKGFNKNVDEVEVKYFELAEKFPELEKDVKICELRERLLKKSQEIESLSWDLEEIIPRVKSRKTAMKGAIKELIEDYQQLIQMGEMSMGVTEIANGLMSFGKTDLQSDERKMLLEYLRIVEGVEEKYNEYSQQFPEIKNNKEVSELREKVTNLLNKIKAIFREKGFEDTLM